MNIFSSAGTHVLRKWPQTLPVLRHECWLGCLSTLPQGITQRQSVTTPVIQCQRGLFGKSKWAECSNWTPEKLSRWERFKFKNDLVTLKVDKEVLKKAQGNIFVCCTDFIDYELFIKDLTSEISEFRISENQSIGRFRRIRSTKQLLIMVSCAGITCMDGGS